MKIWMKQYIVCAYDRYFVVDIVHLNFREIWYPQPPNNVISLHRFPKFASLALTFKKKVWKQIRKEAILAIKFFCCQILQECWAILSSLLLQTWSENVTLLVYRDISMLTRWSVKALLLQFFMSIAPWLHHFRVFFLSVTIHRCKFSKSRLLMDYQCNFFEKYHRLTLYIQVTL